jgi:uncharacterized protein (TIGR03435 family)
VLDARLRLHGFSSKGAIIWGRFIPSTALASIPVKLFPFLLPFFAIFASVNTLAQAPATPPATPASPAASAPAHVPAGAPEFDVATVKPSPPLDLTKLRADAQAGKTPLFGPHVDAARAQYIYMTLKQLIAIAYHIKDYEVEGPAWLGEDRFDIVATLPAGSTKDDAPAMLKSLLQDRFKIEAHPDTAERKVLALLVGKDGPKLKETPAPTALDMNAPLKPGEQQMDGPDGPIRVLRNPDGSTTINMGDRGVVTNRFDMQAQALRIESSGVTMPGFAEILTRVLQVGNAGGPQVVDKTELKGYYVVETEISLADLVAATRRFAGQAPTAASGGAASASGAPTASDPTGGQTVFASVEKLGLKLEDRKAQVTELHIDHAERTPAAN